MERLKNMKESLMTCAQSQISGNLEKVDAKELGEALAVAQDCAILAEVAKMVVAQEENIPTNSTTGVKGTGLGLIATQAVAAADYGETEAMGVAIFKELLKIKTKMSENNVPLADRNCYIKPMALNALIHQQTLWCNHDHRR